MIVGWREWISLPELDIPAIKVKIDTGARTSALHAFDIERHDEDGTSMVHFSVQPVQRNTAIVVRAKAPLVDIRPVTDSGGHSENRLVVSTTMVLGELSKQIELTLTTRENMLFRMLVGRTALAGDVMVDPAGSFLHGRKSTRLLYSSTNEGVQQ